MKNGPLVTTNIFSVVAMIFFGIMSQRFYGTFWGWFIFLLAMIISMIVYFITTASVMEELD